MKDQEILGKNICALRRAFGETQGELADLLAVSMTVIDEYEKGISQPPENIIRYLESHFKVSAECLSGCDFTDYSEVLQDPEFSRLDMVFPVAASEEALKNEHFLKAYNLHMTVYDYLYMKPYEYMACLISLANEIDQEYRAAEAELKDRAPVFVNYMATVGALNLMVRKGVKCRRNRTIEPVREADRSSGDQIEYEDEKLRRRWKTTLYQSDRWKAVSDYYTALDYVWNFVKNDFPPERNTEMGMEMLYIAAGLGNQYALRFLRWLIYRKVEMWQEVQGISTEESHQGRTRMAGMDRTKTRRTGYASVDVLKYRMNEGSAVSSPS